MVEEAFETALHVVELVRGQAGYVLNKSITIQGCQLLAWYLLCQGQFVPIRRNVSSAKVREKGDGLSTNRDRIKQLPS